MKKFRWVFNLLTLAALAYAVLEIKGFLNTNFVENDTKAKHHLNEFLNGKTPEQATPFEQRTSERTATIPEAKHSEPPSLPQKSQE